MTIDTYQDHSIRPTTNATEEAVRWLPNGARRALYDLTPTDSLNHLPSVILDHMARLELTRVKDGVITLNALGKKAHAAIQRKLAGQE